MEQFNNFQERLDAYLLGKLEGTALADFEALLAADPDLAREAREAKALKDGMIHFGNEQMRERLRRIKKDALSKTPEASAPPTKIRSLRPRIIWGSVAAVGLLLLAVYLFLQIPPTPEKLFAQNYEAYPLSLTARDTDNKDSLAQINQTYNQGEYHRALQQIAALLQQPGYDKQLLLAAGICALETQQAPKALAYFQQLIDANDPLYADQARWYASLTFLQQNTPKPALPLLEYLANQSDADHHQDAVELLDDLR